MPNRCLRRFLAISSPCPTLATYRRVFQHDPIRLGTARFLRYSALGALLLLPLTSGAGPGRQGEGTNQKPTAGKARGTKAIAQQGTEEDSTDTPQSPIDYPQSTIINPQSPLGIPDIKAAGAILIDAVSGQVLYERNADQPRPMASTTKIMTALLFCEHVTDEKTIITASKLASQVRESSLHIKPGEKVAAHDLLRAILMRSANDACVAAAEHVAGSVPKFADLMNARALEIGCTHTHFTNPHGLQDKQHYTSARDLAMIARQAIQEPRINEVTRMQVCRITRSMDKLDVTMHNHSRKFLKKYAGADGIKTGYTIPAGHCFVGSASRNGWRLIAVVLKSPDFVHETCAIMDYGFRCFEPRVLAKAGDPQGVCVVQNGVAPNVAVVAQKGVQIVVPKGAADPTGAIQTKITLRPQNAPVRVGAVVGMLEAQRNGKTVCSTPLITTGAVPAAPIPALLVRSKGGGKTLWWLTSILAAVVVSLRYGKGITATTKSARRRWRRLTKSLRGSYR